LHAQLSSISVVHCVHCPGCLCLSWRMYNSIGIYF